MGSKGGSTKIYTPSAEETAAAQTQANIDAIAASADVNRYNEVTPWGSVTWSAPQTSTTGTSGTTIPGKAGASQFNLPSSLTGTTASGTGTSGLGGWTRTTELSPELQQQLDLQNQLGISLGQGAVSRSNQLGADQYSLPTGLPSMVTGLDASQLQGFGQQLDTSGLPQLSGGLDTSNLAQMTTSLDTSQLPQLNKDYSADAQAVEQATYDRIQQLINPQYEEQQRALEAQLAATGNPLGSEGYSTEQTRFQRARDEANLAAALESVGAGRDEQSRLFNIASQARGQLTDEQLASAGLAQTARQQGVSEQTIGQQLAQQARQQGVSEQQLAYNQAMQQRQQQLSEQLSNADLARVARQQGIDESLTERNQQLNELAALIQGSPAITTPTSANTAQYQISPADVIGAQQLETSTALQNAQLQQQAANAKKGGASNLAGSAMMAYAAMSDSRLKKNIKPAAVIDGHTYYTYEWNELGNKLGLFGKDFGVLADEVETYRPDLVMVDPDTGYKKVNYGGLH